MYLTTTVCHAKAKTKVANDEKMQKVFITSQRMLDEAPNHTTTKNTNKSQGHATGRQLWQFLTVPLYN